MRKIECVKVPRQKSVYDFLYLYIKLGKPATRYVDTKETQCEANRSRSVDDLYWLVKSEYSSIRFSKFFRTLNKVILDNFNYCLILYCTGIEKATVYFLSSDMSKDYKINSCIQAYSLTCFGNTEIKGEIYKYTLNELYDLVKND